MGRIGRAAERRRSRWWHLAPTLFVSLLMVACSPGAGEPTSSTSTTGPSGDGGTPESPGTGSPAPTRTMTPTQTITTQPVRGTGQTDLIVEIYALQRRDDLVVLDLGVRNESDDSAGVGLLFGKDDADVLRGIYLHDRAGRTKYYPAKAGGECVCSTGLDGFTVPPGQVQSLSATFGKLPAELDETDVYVPHVGTFDEVAVTD